MNPQPTDYKLLNELIELQKQNNREIKYLHAAVTRLLQHSKGWDVEDTCRDVDYLAEDKRFLHRKEDMDRDMKFSEFTLENYGWQAWENARLKLGGWDENSTDREDHEKARLASRHLLPIPEVVKLKELEAIIVEPFGLVKNKSDRRTKVTSCLRSLINAKKFEAEEGTIYKSIENYRKKRDKNSEAKRWPSGTIIKEEEKNVILALFFLSQHGYAKNFPQIQWPSTAPKKTVANN